MEEKIQRIELNNSSYYVEDINLKNKINEIDSKKAEKFSVEEPLSFNNNKISINLTNYATVNSLTDRFNTLAESFNTETSSNTSKFQMIISFLQRAFGESAIAVNNNTINIDIGKIPDLSNYKERIQSIEGNIQQNNTQVNSLIQANKQELTDSINNVQNTLASEISNNNDRLTNLENRCKLLEKELYGNIMASNNDIDYYSRLDYLQKELNNISEHLVNKNDGYERLDIPNLVPTPTEPTAENVPSQQTDPESNQQDSSNSDPSQSTDPESNSVPNQPTDPNSNSDSEPNQQSD